MSQKPAPYSVTPVPQKRVSLVETFANKLGVEPGKMLDTLKATAFRQKGDTVISNEQMMGLLIVANQYDLNPWTKEIYAFPDKANGIVPVVGVDGWSRIINSHPQADGFEFRYSDKLAEIELADEKEPKPRPCPEWCEVVIRRKDRATPIVVREYLDEVYRHPFKGQYGYSPGPWQSHTKRMLRHKTLIQGARIAFGFAGIYDEDEASRIIEAGVDIIDITPVGAQGSPTVSAAGDLNAQFGGDDQGGVTDAMMGEQGGDKTATETRILSPYETLEAKILAAKTPEAIGDVLDMGRLGSPDGSVKPLDEADQKKLKRAAALRTKELGDRVDAK